MGTISLSDEGRLFVVLIWNVFFLYGRFTEHVAFSVVFVFSSVAIDVARRRKGNQFEKTKINQNIIHVF